METKVYFYFWRVILSLYACLVIYLSINETDNKRNLVIQSDQEYKQLRQK